MVDLVCDPTTCRQQTGHTPHVCSWSTASKMRQNLVVPPHAGANRPSFTYTSFQGAACAAAMTTGHSSGDRVLDRRPRRGVRTAR